MNRNTNRYLFGRKVIAPSDTKERPVLFAISKGNSVRLSTLDGNVMDVHLDRRHLFDDRECSS